MISACFHEIPADGLTGAVAAIEGIRDAAVLLNGPTGCKFYHGAVCEDRMQRVDSLDPLRYSEPFYFGQPRVPSTYLDGDDYVFGATEKLESILRRIAKDKGHGLVAVVNSPGAALIGDDLEGFLKRAGLPATCVAVENPGFSTSFADGFEKAAVKAVAALAEDHPPSKEKCINLIGLSLMDRHWEGDETELKRLLGLCGITVNAVLCAGVRTRQIRSLGRACINAGIHADLAVPVGNYLQERFGTPLVVPSCGAPVGFDAVEQFVTEVCDAVGVPKKPAMEEIDRCRGRAYGAISRFHTITGLPEGASFALKAPVSMALPLTRWLYTYLGMVPVAVYPEPGHPLYHDALSGFLEEIGCAPALNPVRIDEIPRVVLASGTVLARIKAMGIDFAGVELSLLSGGRIDVIPRALMGGLGTLYIIEEILNGLYQAFS